METIFENTCVDTQEEYYQLFSWILPKYTRVMGVICCVIGALMLFSSVSGNLAIRYYGIFLLMFGVFSLLNSRINGKSFFQKKVKVYGEPLPPKTYQFFESHFRVFDVDSDATVEYSRIERVGFLKDCIAFKIQPAGAIYTMSNNGFTKGTREEFIKFLAVKCPKLKIKLPDWKW